MIRESNSLLQACKQINALYGEKLADGRLEMAKRAVSVNQHHDAVTGRFEFGHMIFGTFANGNVNKILFLSW